MFGSADETPERRARLRSAPHDPHQQAAHDFTDLLTVYAMTVQLGDGGLAAFFAAELTRKYCEALTQQTK